MDFFYQEENVLEMYVVLLYFSISKADKTGTIQFAEWNFPEQYNKLEALVMLCGVL